MSDPHALTEFPEEQHDYETRQLIAQTVEQTLAKLREQEHAQKLEDELANAANTFADICTNLRNNRVNAYELVKLVAGENADRVNAVSLTVYESTITLGWNIDAEYGWVYATITYDAINAAMAQCVAAADKKRAEEPPVPLADELDDKIPF